MFFKFGPDFSLTTAGARQDGFRIVLTCEWLCVHAGCVPFPLPGSRPSHSVVILFTVTQARSC